MALYTLTCAGCGSSFEAVRSDAETCSGRCRARISRERRSEETAAEIDRATALLASLRAAATMPPPD